MTVDALALRWAVNSNRFRSDCAGQMRGATVVSDHKFGRLDCGCDERPGFVHDAMERHKKGVIAFFHHVSHLVSVTPEQQAEFNEITLWPDARRTKRREERSEHHRQLSDPFRVP